MAPQYYCSCLLAGVASSRYLYMDIWVIFSERRKYLEESVGHGLLRQAQVAAGIGGLAAGIHGDLTQDRHDHEQEGLLLGRRLSLQAGQDGGDQLGLPPAAQPRVAHLDVDDGEVGHERRSRGVLG